MNHLFNSQRKGIGGLASPLKIMDRLMDADYEAGGLYSNPYVKSPRIGQEIEKLVNQYIRDDNNKQQGQG